MKEKRTNQVDEYIRNRVNNFDFHFVAKNTDA